MPLLLYFLFIYLFQFNFQFLFSVEGVICSDFLFFILFEIQFLSLCSVLVEDMEARCLFVCVCVCVNLSLSLSLSPFLSNTLSIYIRAYTRYDKKKMINNLGKMITIWEKSDKRQRLRRACWKK